MPHVVLEHELDLALSDRFGRPLDAGQPRIFGRGITHLSNGRVTNAARPQSRSGESSSDLRAPIDRGLEEVLLRAGPKDHARAGVPMDFINWGDLYADQEVKAAQDIAGRNIRREDLLAAVVHTDSQDILDRIIGA
jgi:hypothetical protein